MSKQHPIDELFRSKLENHAFDAPMGLWENIDKQRNRKKILIGRFGRGRLLVVAGVLLILGISTWFMVQPDKNSSALNLPNDTHESSISDADLLNEEQTASEIELINAQKANKQTASATETQGENNTKVQTAETNIAENKVIAGLTDQAKLKNSTLDENISSANGRDGGISPGLIEKDDNDVGTEPILTAKVNPIEEINEANKEDLSEIDEEENAIKFSMNNSVDRLSNGYKLLSKEATGSHDFTTKETDCPTFKGLPGGLYMDLNASINIAQRTMTSRDPETNDYLLEREKTEIPYFSFSAGLHLTALTGRGVALKSGVDYTQINEAFNFESGTEERIIISFIKDDQGNIIGTDTTYEIGTRKIKANNRYQTVDIPLLVGYEMDYSNFSLSVYGGPFLNVMFAKKGNFVSNETLMPVGVTTGEPGEFSKIFRPRLGLGWFTSFGFAYKLQGGTQIRIEPYFRFYPKSFSSTEFVIDQRYFLTGMKVGIRKRL